MKIDNGTTNFDPTVTAAKTDGLRSQGASRAATTSGVTGKDTVNVSPAAQFATNAINKSNETPDVRPEVVARAKQLLADGKVGDDPYRLADSLIDHALDSQD